MSTNGYRIYLLQMFDGQQRRALDFAKLRVSDQESEETAAEYLHAKMSDLWEILYAQVPVRQPTEPKEGVKPVHLQFDPRPTSSSARIEGSFYYGREGSFPALSRAPQEGSESGRVPMDGQAPVRPYRVIFHLPAQGNTGFMVGEQIGQTCGATHLVSILNSIAHNDCYNTRGADDHQRDGWVRLAVTPMVDDRRIEQFIETMSDAKLTLTRSAQRVDGGPRTGEITIEQDLSVIPRNSVKALVKRWADALHGGRTKDEIKALGASSAGEFFEGVVSDVSEFGDPELKAVENGKNQHVTPGTLDRLFVYPSETPLSQRALRRESGATIRRIVGLVGDDGRYSIEPSSLRLE